MKEKKLLYITVTIAIVILALAGVTYGYFVLRMNGTAANAKVTTARVGTVTFQAEDIDTGSTTVLPGWVSGAKLLQIGMSASDVDADYECTMTFTSRVEDLYLKVENVSGTSANSTYTNYTKINSNSVVLSSGTLTGNQTDKVNYYLQFKETGLDQTSQMGQSIVGTVSCSISSSLEYSNNPTLVSKMLADHPEMLSTTNTEDGSTVRYFSGTSANNFVAIRSNSTTKAVGSYEYYSNISCSADAYRGKTCSSFSGTVYSYQSTSKTYTKYKYCHYDSNMDMDVCEASPLYDSANECYEATAWEGTCIGDESTANTDSRVYASQYECNAATGWDGTCTRVDNSATTRHFTSLSQCQMYAGATSSTCAAIESSCSYVEYNNSSTCSSNSVEPCTAINEVCTKYDLREFTDKSECISHASMLTSSSDCHTVEEHNVTYDEYNFFRIIRTNTDLEGGGVRLIYSGHGALNNNGSVPAKQNAYIGNGVYAGSSLDLNSSVFTTWYTNNLQSINSLINGKAIYCYDRSHETGTNSYNYLTKTRLTNSSPSLKCGADENGVVVDSAQAALDKYTVDSSTGNGSLTKPMGLLTADEAYMTISGTSWLYYNTNNEAAQLDVQNHITEIYLMSLATYSNMDGNTGYYFSNSSLNYIAPGGQEALYRPVISLKSSVRVLSGNGSAASPYIIKTY